MKILILVLLGFLVGYVIKGLYINHRVKKAMKLKRKLIFDFIKENTYEEFERSKSNTREMVNEMLIACRQHFKTRDLKITYKKLRKWVINGELKELVNG